ncbi:MAG: holo-ACP synthase [Verrucomicrobiota bacterium]|jgi:holo-[acyl-carrier protein] synthase|nr:holo-ACP synthase [Verrucomicrobiota bacterium]MDP7048838.1 holo-ACP synthase [Verrucomicrobiota bacterium]
MILGIGIDIVEIGRIRDSHQKLGNRFIERILLSSEIDYCLRHNDPAPNLAARFAAKEAISKAFGTGICAKLSWHDMEIRRRDTGAPYVILHGKGKELFESRGGSAVHLSLSHTSQQATAVAILEKRSGS